MATSADVQFVAITSSVINSVTAFEEVKHHQKYR